MSNSIEKNNSNIEIKVENDDQQNIESYQNKNQMSAIEEEDRLIINSNTDPMTISQIDNYLQQNTTQGQINNLTNINLTEQINNITDADLRKQLMRYDTEDVMYNQNANDFSCSNISFTQQSLSNIMVDTKDYYTSKNFQNGAQGNSEKGDGFQFQFDKSSKYFQKFLQGEQLNDSSSLQSSSIIDYPYTQRKQSPDMRSFLSDLNSNNQDTNTLKAQLVESTQRYKQTLVQNKILIDGYEELKQQVDALTKQVNSQQEQKPHKYSIEEKEQKNNNNEEILNQNSYISSPKIMTKNNRSTSSKHEHLQKQIQDEIIQKQQSEIENLRQKNLELIQQNAEFENKYQSQNFKLLELQSQLNAQDAILNEKNEEIKKLYLQNETFKIEVKHMEQLSGFLSPPVQKNAVRTTGTSVKRKPQRNGSFYSEFNNITQKDRVIDTSEIDYQKDLSIKSVYLPKRDSIQQALQQNQLFMKDENKFFNKSVNSHFSQNTHKMKLNQSNQRPYQKVSIEKINSEIKQLKNSLMNTDNLLRTTRNKNQALSEKVNQAEILKTNLQVLPKDLKGDRSQNSVNVSHQQHSQYNYNNSNLIDNTQNDQEYNENTSQQTYQNQSDKKYLNQNTRNAQFKIQSKQFQDFIQKKQNHLQLNDTNQSELQGESNFTPRDLSQNLPLQIKQYSVHQIQAEKAQNNKNNEEPQFLQEQNINNDQNFTLQNQTPFEINNELQQMQTPINSPQFHNQSQNQIYGKSQNQFHISPSNQNQQNLQQLNFQSQQQINPQQHQQKEQFIPQQFDQSSKVIPQQFQQQEQINPQQYLLQQHQNKQFQINQQQPQANFNHIQQDQFNDNISQQSYQSAYQSNTQSNQQQNIPINQYHTQQQMSNNVSCNQFLSPNQSSSKQNSQVKRNYSNQQLHPNAQIQQLRQSNISTHQMQQSQIQQQSQMERQPSQNIIEFSSQDKYNNILEQSHKGQKQTPHNQPNQILHNNISQSQFPNQFNNLNSSQYLHLANFANSQQINQNSDQQIHQYPQQQILQHPLQQIQLASSVQSLNTFPNNSLTNQGHVQSNYSTLQIPQNQISQSNYYQATNNSLQHSSNISSFQAQFSNYLNTHPNNPNRSSINTVSSIKGENLKKLNQQLTELELEKNLIETKIMKEESKKYGKGINSNAAIQELNQKLHQINLNIEEVRYVMMEQAV